MPSTAFGPCAVSYATRLPAEISLLLFDESDYAQTLAHAMNRAYHSGPFLCAPILAHRRSSVAFEAVREIVTSRTSYWQRRECLDLVRDGRYEVRGETQSNREALSKKDKDSIRDILLASDGIVIRSWAEFTQLAQLIEYRPIRTRRIVAPVWKPVPSFRPTRGAQTIVVWAPSLDALSASIFAVALEELKSPVVIACAGATAAESLGLRARFIDVNDASSIDALLNGTAAIIDATPYDPAFAIEFATSGLPLAASYVSGAYEYIDNLYLYDPWDYRSIIHAALAALGGEPPSLRGPIPRPQDLIDDPPRLGPPVLEQQPLVSVIITTLNRHGILPRAIDSIARQTYPHIEVVVVNDGGRNVDAIVDRLPNVLTINNDRPAGANIATIQGSQAATGDYFIYLSDDEYLFPTHVSRLIYALERTNASVAAGMCAESYLEPGINLFYDFIGTSIRLYRATDPTILRTVPTSMAIPAMAVRSDAAKAIGDLDLSVPFFDDYEWHLRFLARFDFLWISHLIANSDSRLDHSSFSATATADNRIENLSRIWSTQPCPERPDIDRARNDFLDLYRNNAPPPQYPLYRGVTRLREPKRSVFRLE